MEQIGFVREVKGNNIELDVKRMSGCGDNCGSCSSGCDTMHRITLENKVNAKVGDMVEIKGDHRTILKYATLVYIIPIIFLIIGAAIGTKFFDNEVYIFITGIGFFIASGIIIKIADLKMTSKDKNSALKVTRIL